MNLSKQTINKIKGTIYGQVIGDALGLGAEFMTKEEVQKHYPNGLTDYNQIIQDYHRSKWKQGAWTDDTDQFFCIMDSLLENDKVYLLDIASRFYQWGADNPKDIGINTAKVIFEDGYTQNPQKVSKSIWEVSNRNSAPNGALMRNAIVGIWNFSDSAQVRKNAADICKLTHYDPRCVDSCVIHGQIISAELSQNGCSSEYLMDLIAVLDPRIKTYISNNLTADISTLHLGSQKGMGYTLKALAAALWAYTYAESFEQGLLAIINEGGDADTNGCIAASVLGAKFGFDSIPMRWVDGINNVEAVEDRVESLCGMM